MALSNVVLINPSKQRHTRNGRDFLRQTCEAIDNIDKRVSGYAILAWDDIGNTSIAFKSGGPIGLGVAPQFIKDKFQQLITYE